MQTRISEQKVNDIINQLDLKFSKDLQITDDKIMGGFKSEVAKIEDTVKNHFTFSELKNKDIELKCKQLSEQISTTVQFKDF